MPERVGFIGLGDIGLPMAKRVITHGYDVSVCAHIRREPVDEMRKLGAREVRTTRSIAQDSDVIITMLRNDVDTAELVLGSGCVLEGAKAGSAIVMMTTLSPAFCRKVADVAEARDVGILDAPVAGTRLRAITGELGIMVGGDLKLLERCRPILETMGKVIYCGGSGMGQVVKLVNNMAMMINVQGAYEALSWGIGNGADEKSLLDLMKAGSANSWVLQNWEFIKSMNVDPPPVTFRLGAQDLQYALKIGLEMGQSYPLAESCNERLAAGVLELPPKGWPSGAPERDAPKADRSTRCSRSTT